MTDDTKQNLLSFSIGDLLRIAALVGTLVVYFTRLEPRIAAIEKEMAFIAVEQQRRTSSIYLVAEVDRRLEKLERQVERMKDSR